MCANLSNIDLDAISRVLEQQNQRLIEPAKPRGGNIGEPVRHVEFEPLPPVEVPTTSPVEAPQEEPVPV